MNIYRNLARIPVFGSVLTIVNSYVGSGDFSTDNNFAPFSSWARTLLPAIFIACGLTLWIVHPYCNGAACIFVKDSFVTTPGVVATTIFPNILGFGIGVYALIFSLSAGFIKLFHQHAEEENRLGKKISVLTLNADMAYPLLVFMVVIGIGIFQQAYKDSVYLTTFCWVCVWYAIINTFQLIGTIFRLGEHALLDKVEE